MSTLALLKPLNLRCLVWGLSFLFSVQVSASNEVVAAKVLNLKGSVFVLRGMSREPVDKQTKIIAGDTILTESTGRVKLLLSEGNNEVVIGSSTRLVIERVGSVSRSQNGTTLSLKEGKVRSIVNKKYSGEGSDVFEVKTPNSVAGVRGTKFLVTFDRATALSQVATESGAVVVRAGGRELMLTVGMFSSIAGKTFSAPQRIDTNSRINNEIQELSDDSDRSARDELILESESAPKGAKQEIYYDGEGNEVVVRSDSSATDVAGRSPASVATEPAPGASPAPASARTGSVKVDSDLGGVNVVNAVAAPAPPPNTAGNVPGLNASGVQGLTNFVNQNANSLVPAAFTVPIE